MALTENSETAVFLQKLVGGSVQHAEVTSLMDSDWIRHVFVVSWKCPLTVTSTKIS